MSVQLSRIQLDPWTSPNEEGFGVALLFNLGAGFPYGIIVDPDTSRRFVNELGNRYERSMEILDLGHPVVCIADSDGAQHSLEKGFAKFAGVIERSESIDKVASRYGMDVAVLRGTVDSCNDRIENGADGQFGKSLRDDLNPIEQPTFYSVRRFVCGPRYITGHLFSAGEIAGGIHGGDRHGSCATLDCLTFGRIAGANVVKMVAGVRNR